MTSDWDKNQTTLSEEDWATLTHFLKGKSPEIARLKQTIGQVAKTDVTILLRGESGTGKGLAAQAIHSLSPRSKKPFVKILCAAIPEGLLESEFFGFERGSFTGAYRRNPGKFEFAHQGTIFLDEIGDIPQSLQTKLLQVLQDGEFTRIGGREVKVDTRVIAATNRNLEKAIAQGTFRQDLFYRLNVISIVIPPLRERKSDIPFLVEYFLEKYAKQYNRNQPKISSTTLDRILAYSWPGNVRELENAIKQMIVLETDQIRLEPNPPHPEEAVRRRPDPAEAAPPPASEVEKEDAAAPPMKKLKEATREIVQKAEEEVIRRTLQETRWNRKNTAQILGVSYKTLLQKMKLYNLG
jgi:two-component system response regulator AtoC